MLAQIGAGPVAEIAFANEMPLAEMLPQLELALAPGARLEVHLGAGLCPMVAVNYPVGINRLREKEVFAKSVCAAQLGAHADELVVEVDAVQPCITAPLYRSDWEALRGWSDERSLRLVSIQPLWALASRSGMARRAKAVVLQEPDSLTLFGVAEINQPVRALTLPLPEQDQVPSLLHRMQQSLALPVSETRHMCFGGGGQSVLPDLPSFWHGYWSSP
ncbi:MAG TPA: hypothetical protein VK996_09700 [Ramlibacter sp.]|nr:hypothetical protein [Ramlibacter sp.]